MQGQLRTVDMTDPLNNHLGFLVHDLARAFTAAYAARMPSPGLSRPQARAIAHVRRFPERSAKDSESTAADPPQRGVASHAGMC